MPYGKRRTKKKRHIFDYGVKHNKTRKKRETRYNPQQNTYPRRRLQRLATGKCTLTPQTPKRLTCRNMLSCSLSNSLTLSNNPGSSLPSNKRSIYPSGPQSPIEWHASRYHERLRIARPLETRCPLPTIEEKNKKNNSDTEEKRKKKRKQKTG